MVSANDPIESFFNSIQHFKETLSPIELGIKKAAKDLESCLVADKKNVNNLELVNGNEKNSKIQTLMKKKGNGNSSGKECGNGQCVGSEEKKKGSLSIRVPVKTFLGMFSPNFEKVEVVSKKGVKDKALDKDDGSCMNCLQFAVAWSLLFNGFVQSFPSPFKMGKKRIQKLGEEDKGHLSSCVDGTKSKVSCEFKRNELKSQLDNACKNDGGAGKEGKPVLLECFIGFVFDQLIQNLQKFDQLMQESDQKGCDCSPSSSPPSQFDHLKALISIWEGRKAEVDGFLGNLKFARVGGMPSSIVGVTNSVNEEGENGVSSDSREETGGNSAQKVASGILSIPLSNVERLRSTLSTVSLTELIELLPQLGRTSKDHPDKKKLFSVQDFFRYTEAEGIVLMLLSYLLNVA